MGIFGTLSPTAVGSISTEVATNDSYEVAWSYSPLIVQSLYFFFLLPVVVMMNVFTRIDLCLSILYSSIYQSIKWNGILDNIMERLARSIINISGYGERSTNTRSKVVGDRVLTGPSNISTDHMYWYFEDVLFHLNIPRISLRVNIIVIHSMIMCYHWIMGGCEHSSLSCPRDSYRSVMMIFIGETRRSMGILHSNPIKDGNASCNGTCLLNCRRIWISEQCWVWCVWTRW